MSTQFKFTCSCICSPTYPVLSEVMYISVDCARWVAQSGGPGLFFFFCSGTDVFFTCEKGFDVEYKISVKMSNLELTE